MKTASNLPSEILEGNVVRRLAELAWPAVVEYLLQTVLQMVTIAMVGRLGAPQIASVGVGQQILQMTRVAFMGLSVATTALIARSYGAGNRERAELIAKQSLLVGVILSIGIGITLSFFVEPMMSLMGAKSEVIEQGAEFLRIQLIFSFFPMVMIVVAGALRGAGDMKSPMIINGFVNGVNLILGYGLIFGEFGLPRMEVTGAAWAVVAAQAIGALILLAVLFIRPKYLKLKWRGNWSPNPEVDRNLLEVGGPSMIEQILMNFGMLLYAVLVIRLGTEAYAVQSILFTVLSISFMPGFAVAVAATTVVGQNVGGRRFDRAEKSGWAAMNMGMIWMTLMGVVFFIFPSQCLGLFTSDPALIALGEPCLRIIALVQPFSAITFALSGSLRGAGDTRFPMFATAGTIWLFRLPFATLLGLILPFGLTGMWVAHALDFVTRSGLYILRFRLGKWKYLRFRGED